MSCHPLGGTHQLEICPASVKPYLLRLPSTEKTNSAVKVEWGFKASKTEILFLSYSQTSETSYLLNRSQAKQVSICSTSEAT